MLTHQLGFWSSFWHDLFRFAFVSIGFELIPDLPSTEKKTTTSTTNDFLRMNIAFIISGLMHAAGSYTQYKATHPGHVFIGFFVQGLGVALQRLICKFHTATNLPPHLSKATIFSFTIIWACMTAPLVIGDMALGGLFRTKAIPFSVVEWRWF